MFYGIVLGWHDLFQASCFVDCVARGSSTTGSWPILMFYGTFNDAFVRVSSFWSVSTEPIPLDE